MWPELHKHRWAYSVLITAMILFVGLFLAVWPNRWLMRTVAGAMAFFYVSWGVLSHVKTTTLTKRVLYEYVGVAGLALLGLLIITW